MSDSLPKLLGAIDRHPAPTFTRYETLDWPGAALDQYLAAGILCRDEPPQSVICLGCGEYADVHVLPGPSGGEVRACLSCGFCGPQFVPHSEIACWRLDFGMLLDHIALALGVSGNREELVRGRVWRLGRSRLGGAARSVYFARQLARRDAWQVVQDARFPAGALVLVPRQVPPPYLRIDNLPSIVRLVEVATWSDGRLAVDPSYFAGELAPNRPAAAEEPAAKRGQRLALIEALQHELAEHLRAARDYARTTRQRSGTPELLPRPTCELLARQLGVHRTTVSRCLEDPSARELRLLWEVAADLDRILALGA